MRPRTVVTLLEPSIAPDRHTEESRPDWDQTPQGEFKVPAVVEPVSSTEQALTAGAITERWTLFVDRDLDPYTPGAVVRMTSDWRVTWRGVDYEIIGAIEVIETSRRAGGEQYRTCLLERISG